MRVGTLAVISVAPLAAAQFNVQGQAGLQASFGNGDSNGGLFQQQASLGGSGSFQMPTFAPPPRQPQRPFTEGEISRMDRKLRTMREAFGIILDFRDRNPQAEVLQLPDVQRLYQMVKPIIDASDRVEANNNGNGQGVQFYMPTMNNNNNNPDWQPMPPQPPTPPPCPFLAAQQQQPQWPQPQAQVQAQQL